MSQRRQLNQSSARCACSQPPQSNCCRRRPKTRPLHNYGPIHDLMFRSYLPDQPLARCWCSRPPPSSRRYHLPGTLPPHNFGLFRALISQRRQPEKSPTLCRCSQPPPTRDAFYIQITQPQTHQRRYQHRPNQPNCQLPTSYGTGQNPQPPPLLSSFPGQRNQLLSPQKTPAQNYSYLHFFLFFLVIQ